MNRHSGKNRRIIKCLWLVGIILTLIVGLCSCGEEGFGDNQAAGIQKEEMQGSSGEAIPDQALSQEETVRKENAQDATGQEKESDAQKAKTQKANDKNVSDRASAQKNTKQKAKAQIAVKKKNKSLLAVHFIDVGQGDAILAVCDKEAMLIDGGNAAASDTIYTYLKQNNIDHLKYIICTHPDEDHVGGLAGALNYATADHAYCSETEHDTRAFNSFLKYLKKQNVPLEVPETGTEFTLGAATATICGPVESAAGTNNNSLVIRLQLGKISFLFTGDAEEAEEQDMISAGGLESTVLKVAHHGSNNSTSDDLLDAVNPKFAVISCGKKNSYGHPTDGVLKRLKTHKVRLYRTDMQGDIICKTNGKKVAFAVERNKKANTFLTYHNLYVNKKAGETRKGTTKAIVKQGAQQYILNTNTGKFHYPDCRGVKQMSDKNKYVITATRDEVIAMGYESCGWCHP